MSTLVITMIFILFIVVICLALMVANSNSLKRNTSSLLKKLENSAKENNLEFVSPELLRNCAFAVDAFQKKLLIVKRETDTGYDSVIIDLAALKTCSKKKTWMHMPAGNSAKQGETHLEKIALELSFTGDQPPAELIFYEYRYDSLFEMPELEQKARHWENLFSGIENATAKNTRVPISYTHKGGYIESKQQYI